MALAVELVTTDEQSRDLIFFDKEYFFSCVFGSKRRAVRIILFSPPSQ